MQKGYKVTLSSAQKYWVIGTILLWHWYTRFRSYNALDTSSTRNMALSQTTPVMFDLCYGTPRNACKEVRINKIASLAKQFK